jgi:hypothetical protein
VLVAGFPDSSFKFFYPVFVHKFIEALFEVLVQNSRNDFLGNINVTGNPAKIQCRIEKKPILGHGIAQACQRGLNCFGRERYRVSFSASAIRYDISFYSQPVN